MKLNIFAIHNIVILIILLSVNLFFIPYLFVANAKPEVIAPGSELDTPANQECNGQCVRDLICTCRSYRFTAKDGSKQQCQRTDWTDGKSYCLADSKFASTVKDISASKPSNPCESKEIDGVTYQLYSTALGCMLPTTVGITNFIIRLLIGAGMGIAVVKGSMAIWKWRNAESPDKKQEAIRELTSVLIGLILIFLAVPLLNFIGIDVLNLDMYGGSYLTNILQ